MIVQEELRLRAGPCSAGPGTGQAFSVCAEQRHCQQGPEGAPVPRGEKGAVRFSHQWLFIPAVSSFQWQALVPIDSFSDSPRTRLTMQANTPSQGQKPSSGEPASPLLAAQPPSSHIGITQPLLFLHRPRAGSCSLRLLPLSCLQGPLLSSVLQNLINNHRFIRPSQLK